MAAFPCASAHASSLPSCPESPDAESLALQACDDVDSLHAVHRAYACIEKLIVPQRVGDTEEVFPTRTELGALVRLMNEELQRRIEAAVATTQSLRAALGKGSVK